MEPKFNNPFVTEGNWYKGNLHTHTTNSDGSLSPVETVKQYKEAGYHFLSITDHCRLTKVEGNQGILLIPGQEMHCGTTEAKFNFHLVGLNLKEEISYAGDEIPIFRKKWWEVHPQEMIDAVKSQGGEIILAHPYWSALTTNDIFSCQGYIGTEVFNTSCLYGIDKGYSMHHWDDLLVRGRNVFGFANDDAHNSFNEHRQNDACGAWIMVKSKKLTVYDIMEAIKKGLFYASCGPEIKDVKISGGNIFVATSPVKSISFIAPNGHGEMFTALKREPLREVEYKIRGQERYIRIQCTDREGRMAWTNAIFFE
ncbi:hypothetical protein AUJ66_03890 [Candidatus Desantisbacteria bacterium CG1_02_38_46]|uniref:Polymerase/histidinol phosphatase N-terminal domain-containing protein n=3 Tax=unclassified Candidatus Desantisiibacteriota TaxID=3106372 RepID=A0A2H9P9H9_9BACT|nr:MAG: hypothetical protein AUJ66_03890 [Candidatus Desantisbacteria bacterium CG1_02_38_46]PIU51926.1 MAG: hypothetical protein COS91_01905 [Candidatus Desantisbacteria bacterium CG07_land_8_20_14_0_80_39_15]PIZ14877.1 MAG: hypothetical protein COY51_07070 [Candidatus Desantisbacteria bacterium CG_4_10_14_0_8_um_filter_39_17]